MPQWDGQSGLEEILSVGLTFRALLMGLPRGLLGSSRLYEVLREIYDASISRPFETTPRVQLIAFATIALTSEMERSLICATFGLLTYLQQKTDESALPEVPQPGTSLRRVASLQNLDNLARVFGPTLLGDYQPELGSADETEVDRETVYYCVARLLLENWQGVNRQLRDWAAGSKQE